MYVFSAVFPHLSFSLCFNTLFSRLVCFSAVSPAPSPDCVLFHGLCRRHRRPPLRCFFLDTINSFSLSSFCPVRKPGSKESLLCVPGRAGSRRCDLLMFPFRGKWPAAAATSLLNVSFYHRKCGVGSNFTSLNQVLPSQMSKDAILLKVLNYFQR